MKGSKNRGFVLLVVSFVFLVVSLLVVSYLRMVHYQTSSFSPQAGHLQAYEAAKAGVEDALYELKQGAAWPTGAADVQWASVSGNTLQKSTNNPSHPLTHFDLPVTYSVTVAFESGTSGTINIISSSVVGSGTTFASQIAAKAIRTSGAKMYLLEMKEE